MKKKILIPLAVAFVLSTTSVVVAEEPDTTTAASDATTTASEEPAPAAPKEEAKPAPKPAPKEAAKPAPKPATPKEAAKPAAPVQNSGATYTVVAGDTLAKIAARFGVTVDELVALNSIQNPNLIFVGQVFAIPGAKPAAPAEKPAPPIAPAEKPAEIAPPAEGTAPAETTTEETTTEETTEETTETTTAETTTEETDVVASASPKESADPEQLATGLSKDGYWIFAILDDVTYDGILKVDGTFYNDDDPATKIYRKLALYAQDAERNVTASYELTADAMVVTSPNFRIQNGTFNGDIYVNADGFELKGTTVNGNVYFTTEAQKASALLTEGKITGETAVKEFVEADIVTSASPKESADPAALVKGLSKDGYWIFAILDDVTVKGDVAVDGTFHSDDDATAKVYRKLALYAQDEDRNVTAQYKLTLDRMLVTSPNFRIQNGTVVGDVYVNADGFELNGSTIEGNLYFATEAQQASALLEKGKVTGKTEIGVAKVDVVASASPKESKDPAALVSGLSETGYWIFAVTDDVTVDGDLDVVGTFYKDDDDTTAPYRKLALYAQDADHKVTAEYALTVANMHVTTPNFRIQNGTINGDVYVDATGFDLRGTDINGNLYFASEEQYVSAAITGTVSGEIVILTDLVDDVTDLTIDQPVQDLTNKIVN